MAAIRALGAELKVVDGPPLEAELLARRHAEEQGKVYISPYNDLDVVAGQGTLGMELIEQAPDLDAVFISVGGGGLISGVGTALKNLSPRTKVVGVWPENSPCMLRALEAEGFGFECVSLGELDRVFEMLPDLDPTRVLFTPSFSASCTSASMRATEAFASMQAESFRRSIPA